jgi:hypothetical protein
MINLSIEIDGKDTDEVLKELKRIISYLESGTVPAPNTWNCSSITVIAGTESLKIAQVGEKA